MNCLAAFGLALLALACLPACASRRDDGAGDLWKIVTCTRAETCR
ncbi:hypothetical protein LJR009_001582 [Bosea sp. LjRoot9]